MTDLRDPKNLPVASEEDPLQSLYRMSRTAGLGSGDYVAINSVSIVAIILGILAVTALLFQTMGLFAIAAIICGVIALVQINRSNETQGGRLFAVGGIVLGLAFGGLTAGRMVSAHLERQRDTQEISKLLARFSEMMAGKQYAQAYQTLFTEGFKRQFTEREFVDRWDAMIGFAGAVKSVGWGERAEFEQARGTDTRHAVANSEFVFENRSARQPMSFMKVGNGEWEIDAIQQLFEKPKEGKQQAPALNPSQPQGPTFAPPAPG